MIRDMAKYYRIDAAMRAQKQREWNQPIYWPLFVIFGLLALAIIPVLRLWRRREETTGLARSVSMVGEK